MATWMPENTAKRLADWLASGTAVTAETGRELVLFSTVPTPAGDASDGVEAAARQPFAASAATSSPGAPTAEADMAAAVTFTALSVASSAIVGIGLADATTGTLRLVNDNWRPARQDIAAGGDLRIEAAELSLLAARSA